MSLDVTILEQIIYVNINEDDTIYVSLISNDQVGQSAIQFKDEGINLGTQGTVTQVDFVGNGVTASRSGAKLTVTISSGNVTGSGSQGQIPYWTNSSNISGTNNLFWDNANTTLYVGGNSGAFTSSRSYIIGTLNSYLQSNITNISNGGDASSDFVATSDNGNDSSNYIDVGINSSAYNNSSFTITGPNDGYIYTNGGNLAIGTQSAKDIIFHTNGTLAANEVLRIKSTGNIIARSSVTTGTGATSGLQFIVNSLTTGNGIDASTSSLTSGILLKAASTSTAINHTLGSNSVGWFEISGANANSSRTAIALSGKATNTGTFSTNVGIYGSASGGTTNYAGYFDGSVRVIGSVRFTGAGTTTGVLALFEDNSSTARLTLLDNGVLTATASTSGSSFGGTWTASAANDTHFAFGGNITDTSSGSAQVLYGYNFNITMNRNGANPTNHTLTSVAITPTFVGSSNAHLALDVNPTWGTPSVKMAARFVGGIILATNSTSNSINNTNNFQLVWSDATGSGTAGLAVKNLSNNAAAFTEVTLHNDAGSTGALIHSSSAYSSASTAIRASSFGLYTASTGGAYILTSSTNANAKITFVTGGTLTANIRQSIDKDGNFVFTQSAQSSTNTFQSFTQSAHTGGSPVGLLFTGGAHTGLTASAEITDIYFNNARTVQRATGAVSTDRTVRFPARTNSFVGASTITTAINVNIGGPPVAGPNATQTIAIGLNIESNNVGSGTTTAYGIFSNAATGASKSYALGTSGNINMSSLPTSSVGLSTGDIWNNLGILSIV